LGLQYPDDAFLLFIELHRAIISHIDLIKEEIILF